MDDALWCVADHSSVAVGAFLLISRMLRVKEA